MTAKLRVMAVAVGCVLAGAASSARADQFLLTGSSRGLWLVRLGPQGETFDVLALTKPSATKWRWMSRGLLGSPAAAAALDKSLQVESLHVLLAKRKGYLVFPLAGGDGLVKANADDSRWAGRAVPVAACAAENFAGAEGKSLVAVVLRKSRPVGGSATRAASRADTRRASSKRAAAPAEPITLGVFQNGKTVEGTWRWRHVVDLPGLAADSDVLAAVRGGRLYLLIRPPAGHNRLATWRDGQWSDVPLSGSTAAADALGMVVIGGKRLLLVTSVGQSNPGSLQIVEFDDSGKVVSVQPIVRDGKAVEWHQEAMPLISRLADQLALVWRDGDAMKFATCSLAGQLGATHEITILGRTLSDKRGDKLLEYFLWALLGVTMCGTLFLQPRAPFGQFKMPETLHPAPLGKRLLAGILDLVPFVMVAVAVLAQRVWPMLSPLEKSADQLQEVLVEMQSDSWTAYTLMGTAVAYLGYCVLMELQHGATVGKMLLGLRVVGDGGVQPNVREALLRNVVKVMILMSWLLPLMLIVLLNRNRQRLGDMMGRTAVIDAPPGAGLAPPPDQQTGDDDSQET